MDRQDLPIEAVKINNQYIEDAIEGYSTLITSGREGLSVELGNYTAGISDGERIKSSRYPSRSITVDFAIKGDSMEDLRDKLNQLNNLLSVEDADFVFNDESDKFFTGRTIIGDSFTPYKNAATGSYTIFCPDPFKYSIAPITKSTTDAEGVTVTDNSAVFTFDYSGSYPARPILRAEFATSKSNGNSSEDGDCGFVLFVDPDENIIQLGNPDATDYDESARASTLINKEFTTIDDWTSSGITTSSIRDTYWQKGKGQTLTYAKGIGTLSKAVAPSINFDVALVHRMNGNKTSEKGTFALEVKSGDTVVVGVLIEKSASGTSGKARYIINGKRMGWNTIDLSYYNKNLGFCKRTKTYVTKYYNKRSKKWQYTRIKGARTKKVSDGYEYTQSNLNSTIKKVGNKVTFKIGNLVQRTFIVDEIAEMTINSLSMAFTGNLDTNAVRSVKLTNRGNTFFEDIPNVFTAGDIVEADCNDASVYLMRAGTVSGDYAPEYGALGNDWEAFTLERGTNIISVAWSDWVNPSYKPKISIIYNEVFI